MDNPFFAALIVLVIAAAVLGAFAAKLKRRDNLFAKPWPLEAKRQLLTDRERALYQRLVQVLPNHIVLAQVQLSLDFLILNPDTSVVAAVELDDATHTQESRRQADARKSHALQSAGVPLVRWNAKSLPDAAAILAALPTKASGS